MDKSLLIVLTVNNPQIYEESLNQISLLVYYDYVCYGQTTHMIDIGVSAVSLFDVIRSRDSITNLVTEQVPCHGIPWNPVPTAPIKLHGSPVG